ncbi:MAG: mechanosensitive ion channel family protein, partial [Shimia sp.]|nr:mechanosensitive ion channel family protein [Shimia sp.]
MTRIVLALLLSAATLFSASLSQAQTLPLTSVTTTTEPAPVAPEEMTPDAINAMVARMSDDDVRALLLDRLDAVAMQGDAAQPTMSLIDRASLLWSAFSSQILDALQKLPVLFVSQGEAFATFLANYGGLAGVLTLFGLIALSLAIAFAAEFAVRTYLVKLRNPDPSTPQHSLREALTFLIKRFFREIFGLIVFFVVLRVIGVPLFSEHQIVFVAPFVGYLIWMPRVAAAFSRFMMAPERPDLRLVSISDHWAKFIHRHVIGLMLLGGFTLFIVEFNMKNGVPMGTTRIGFWLDSAVYVYIAYIAWTARDGLSAMMRGTDPDNTEFDEWVARAYPVFAMAVAGAMWVIVSTIVGLGMVRSLAGGAHYTTMFLLLLTPVIDTAIRGLVRHLVPPMQGEGPVAEEAYVATKRSYVRIGRVIAVGLVLMLIARAWEVSFINLLQDRAGIGDNLFSFAMTVIVGYVVYEAVSLWINRRLAAEFTALGLSKEDAGGDEMGGGGGSRLSTVLPLALLTAQGTIIVIFALLA